MGPIRGLRKKKKLEGKFDSNGIASDSSKKDEAMIDGMISSNEPMIFLSFFFLIS